MVNCICKHGDSLTDTKVLLHETVQLYHEELMKLDVDKDYTYEECLNSFFVSVLEKFSWLFAMFCGEEGVYKLPILQYIHDILSFVITSCNIKPDCTPLRPMMLT